MLFVNAAEIGDECSVAHMVHVIQHEFHGVLDLFVAFVPNKEYSHEDHGERSQFHRSNQTNVVRVGHGRVELLVVGILCMNVTFLH